MLTVAINNSMEKEIELINSGLNRTFVAKLNDLMTKGGAAISPRGAYPPIGSSSSIDQLFKMVQKTTRMLHIRHGELHWQVLRKSVAMTRSRRPQHKKGLAICWEYDNTRNEEVAQVIEHAAHFENAREVL